MLEINNLHVKLEDEDKQILKGVDLKIEAGSVGRLGSCDHGAERLG